MNDKDDKTVIGENVTEFTCGNSGCRPLANGMSSRDGGSGWEIFAGVALIGFYYLMSIFSLLIHLWLVKRVWDLEGIWWATLYFFLFIYLECYWAYRSFMEQGFNFFAFSCAIVGVWWFLLLLFRNKLSQWCARVGGEDESNSNNITA